MTITANGRTATIKRHDFNRPLWTVEVEGQQTQTTFNDTAAIALAIRLLQ